MEFRRLSETCDFVRNGFSTARKWLRVRPATSAALCGVKGGRFGLCCAVGSSFSSGGVRKGSSGGCCCTHGKDVAERYDVNEGALAVGAMQSRDHAGSIVISGICGAHAATFDRELALKRFALRSTAASADRCLLRKLPAVSEDIPGDVGRDGSGFITRN